MAAGDISVVINSETKAFRQGVESGIIKPLEDAEKSLDELGKSKGPDQLTRELEGAQRASEDLDDEVKRTARSIEQEFRDSYRKAGDAADGFQRDASGNIQGFKDEAVQNLSEVASSFDGDLQSMADGVQGLTGGLASSLTPGIGIPVAILGAAAGAFLQSWISAAEDSEERVQEMYAAMSEEGSKFLSAEYFNKALANLDTSKIEEAQQRAIDLGVEERDVLRAMVGDREAIGRVLASQQQHYNEELQAIRDSGKSLEDQSVAVDALNTKYGEQNEFLRDMQRDTGAAADLWESLNGAMEKTPGAVAAAEGAVARFRQSVSGGITIPVRADTSQLDSALNRAQRKAAAGIDVIVRANQVLWQ